MKEEIKNLRIQCDGLAQLTKELKPINDTLTFNDFNAATGVNRIAINPRNSKEIDKVVDSLYLAKAWLGKLLGELNTGPTEAEIHIKYKELGGYGAFIGNESQEIIDKENKVKEELEKWKLNYGNPYGSGYKTKEDIVPTQDVFKDTIQGTWNDKNHIEKVDWLRTEINQLSLQILVLPDYNEKSITKYNAYTHLCEARFWLGFEMERIKNEKS